MGRCEQEGEEQGGKGQLDRETSSKAASKAGQNVILERLCNGTGGEMIGGYPHRPVGYRQL